jgi:hypothetical protein
MVPKQLANTIEFMLERSVPAIGAVVAIVIGPSLLQRVPRSKNKTAGHWLK